MSTQLDVRPDGIPAKVVIEHIGIFNSDGSQTTAAANELQQFVYENTDGTTENVTTGNSVTVTAIGNDLNFTVNSQTRKNFVPSGNSLTLNSVGINSITIVENGVDFSYVGGYYR